MRTAPKTLIAVVAAGFGVLALPAVPAAAQSANVTIGQLEAQGFDVRVDRIGSAPLSECVVLDIRNPQEQTRPVRIGDRNRVVDIVVKRTVSVSLDCSR
jgi:hypothetical protein